MAEYQRIYNMLRAAGISQMGALGLMGNWDCESNCEPCRVQGDFSSDRSTSKRYAANVNSGATSRQTFMNDQKGWGIAQWTYFTRKGGLYDYAKFLGTGIESLECQVQYALRELSSDFSGLLAYLKTTTDLDTACSRVCKEFERPAYDNVGARIASANRIAGQINLDGGDEPSPDPTPDPSPDPEPTPEPVPAAEFWPPRVVCKGMKGKDIEVLCAVLKAREYDVHYVTDEFGSFLEESVIAFQKAAFPGQEREWDGIVGPKTWEKLLNLQQ